MNKVNEICAFVDVLIDEFTLHKKKPKISFIKYLQSENVDRKTINDFIENNSNFIQSQIDELDIALTGDDYQVKESYSNYRKPELREFKEMLLQIIDDSNKYKDSKKIVRKKKKTSPDKLVKNVKLFSEPYQVGDSFITTLDAVAIVGSKHIFLYNTKTRELAYYTGDSLSIKGMTIINFDVDKSWIKTLRKPEQVLTKVASCTKMAIENISSLVTTKPKVATGRINSNQILVKAIT